MLRRYTLLKVNIREHLPRPYIRAPHSCLPQIAQTTNHIRNSLSGHFFSSLLEHRTEFLELGKAAIAFILVRYEDPAHLWRFFDQNWLRYLFGRMNASF